MKLINLLTWQEHQALNDECRAKGWYMYDRRAFLPGMGWYNEWYLELDTDDREFLSIHYKQDWQGKRPPIELVCPNGSIWCIDRKSSNGTGWVVTGSWSNITCSPSIIANDYHGFLRNGEFTPDLDGKTWPVPNIGPDYGICS